MPTLNSKLTGDETVLFAMPGSQFAAKALAAIDHVKIPYRVVLTDPTKLKKDLEPPHTVPQMRWKGELLVDSMDIMEKLDEACGKIYPKDAAKKAEVKEFEKWLGDYYNKYALYFGWVDEEGFWRSHGQLIIDVAKLGWAPACCSHCIVARATKDQRDIIRQQAREKFGEAVVSEGSMPEPGESEKVKKLLLEDTTKIEAHFKTDDQEWVFPGDGPTAADFTLYGILEKLQGDSGDAQVGPCTPWLFKETGAKRLEIWHERMRYKFPIIFRGKFKEAKVYCDHQ